MMKIKCDQCERAFDDVLMQISDEKGQILYLCPECFTGHAEHPADEQP